MSKKTTLLLIGLVFLVLGSGFGLTVGKSSGDRKDVCGGKSSYTFMVDIHDGKPSNTDIKGKFCDKIMFTNSDAITREVGFGPHDEHQPYDGVGEKVINKGQAFTITLSQSGKFHWHDHLHEEVEGYFTVTQ